ncbi:tetratricopeptide repeat protein 39C-like [Watersipora subatra]|uniref:tetratricopeptide repeat protein 39C-like n=1 Tax=Watersipora subatra TaxID=2589382 RepID=UPI00355B23AC
MSDTDEQAVDLSAGLDNVQIEDTENDNNLGVKGIVLLLNNHWDESRELFEKHRSQSLVMHFGGAFVHVLQAIMALEEEKIAAAKVGMEDVEKKCRESLHQMKKQKKKSKGTQSDTAGQEDRWMCQIIIADSLLFQAVMTFMNQDIPSYMKGGWLLRKSWKIYEKVHKDISEHYDDSRKNGKVKVRADSTSIVDQVDKEEGANGEPKIGKVAEVPAAVGSAEGTAELMTKETLSRLLGAVSFGYGAFQLALSMLPDKVLKLIELIGFHSDKENGLKALEFSMHSKDMRAPLAVLTMLWYKVLLKPFYTETFQDEELKEVTDLIEQYQSEYPESAMFLFFKGRVCRLQKDLDGALAEYEKAKELCEGLIELRNGAMFEIGWCNLMKLNYDTSMEIFSTLLESSKWSKCFYTYMVALCQGSKGAVDIASNLMKTVPGLVKRKTNQIEAFVSRRAQQFKKIKLTDTLCELLILELIYMWNNLSQCSRKETDKMLAICGAVEEKKFFHVRSLIEGAIYRQHGDLEFSDQCFKEALARHEGLKYDYHIAAHALYERGNYRVQNGEKTEEGKKMLLKAKDGFKEYDFENRLNVRIRALLSTLDGQTKK